MSTDAHGIHATTSLPNMCLPPLNVANPPPVPPQNTQPELSAQLGFKPLVVPGLRALRGSSPAGQQGPQGDSGASVGGWSGNVVPQNVGNGTAPSAYKGVAIPIRPRGRLPLNRSRSGIPPPILIPRNDFDPTSSSAHIKLEAEDQGAAEINPGTKRRVVMYQPESPTRTGKNRYKESGQVIDGAALSKQPRRRGTGSGRSVPMARGPLYTSGQQPLFSTSASVYGNIAPNGALMQAGRPTDQISRSSVHPQPGQVDLEALAEINAQYRNVQAAQGQRHTHRHGMGHASQYSVSGSSASDWVEMNNRMSGMGFEGASADHGVGFTPGGSASSNGIMPSFQPPELSTSCGSPTSMGSSIHELPSSTHSGGSLLLPKIEPESPPAFPHVHQQPYPAFQSVPLMTSQGLPMMYYPQGQGGGASQPRLAYQSWMIPEQRPGPILAGAAAKAGKKTARQVLPMFVGQHPSHSAMIVPHQGHFVHVPYGISPRATPYPPMGVQGGKGKKKLHRHGEREVQGVPQYVLDTGVSADLKARFDACEHLDGKSPLSKPNRTYASLVAEAILNAPYPHQLNIAEIFHSIAGKYPFFSYKPIQIYNGIRHATTQSQHFVKLDRQYDDQSGKGRYWTIKPGSEALFANLVMAGDRSKSKVGHEMSSDAGSVGLSSRMQSPEGSMGMSMSSIGSGPAPKTPGMQVDQAEDMDTTPIVQLNTRVADTTPRPVIPFRIPPIQEPRTGNTPVLGFQIPRITSGSHLESIDRHNALISDVSVLMSDVAQHQKVIGNPGDNVIVGSHSGQPVDANGAIRLTTSNVSLKDPFPSVPSGYNNLRQPFEGVPSSVNGTATVTPSVMGFVPKQSAPTISTLPTHVYNKPSSMISKAIDHGGNSSGYGSLCIGQRANSYNSQRKPGPIRSSSMPSVASVSSSASSLASAMDISLVRERSSGTS